MEQNLSGQREIVEHLDREFAHLITSLKALVGSIPGHLIYQRPPSVTVGEHILKSAALAEQTFGGLTANLWDHPFEWTLPETLSTAERIVEYLTEVDEARVRAFSCIVDDATLLKYIAVPADETRRLIALLIETLVRASNHHGQAIATLKLLKVS